jgi:hypothetical protein
LSRLKYTPPKSVSGFLTSEKFINLIVGPVGSTKTTAGIMKIAYEAKQMAASRDGIRRSRAIWIRNTAEQLRDTSIPDFLKWYPDGQAGVFEKTNRKFILRFDDVECEVLFRGLDDANDVRRLLSLQASFAVMDEFREIHPDIFEAVQGRLGRYPDGMMVPHREEWGVDAKGNPIMGCVTDAGKSNAHIWGMTNPPDMDTFWEQFLTNPPDNAAVFFQPSGLDPEADWVQFLPSEYYENLAEGKSEDWIDVYIHAKFGKSLSGKPVFGGVFDRDTHVAKEPLRPNLMMNNPVIVGFDCTGLGPAAVIGQMGFGGRLFIYDVMSAGEMGPLRFIREKLKPLLTEKYAGGRVVVCVDPAGMARGADEKNIVDMLKTEGLVSKPARTNGIAARIAAVEQFLTRTVDGKPGMLIDPGATDLIQALSSKYRFKKKTTGEFEDLPQKIRPWADIADALQYLCLHADGGSLFGAEFGDQRREVKKSGRKIV